MTTPGRDLNERSNSLFAAASGAGAVLVGALLIAGSTGGPVNALLRGFAPLEVWGVGFIAGGAAGLTGQALRRWQLIAAGHAAGCALSVVIAAAFYLAGTRPGGGASLHGAGAYLTLAVVHLLAAMVSRPLR